MRVPDPVAVGDWVRTTTGRTGQSSGVGKKVGDSTGKGEMEGGGREGERRTRKIRSSDKIWREWIGWDDDD